jgi:PAS domain S-box-containing protein
VTRSLSLPELEARLTAGVRNARLLQSESRLRALIANVPGAIYRCANDPAWTMNLISDEIQRISGYPASEFVDSEVRTFSSIIHADDREQVEREVRAATSENRQFVLEYRIVRKDGTIAWVLERGQQVRDGTGQAWLEGVIFDVSDRKQAEEQLRESERRLAVASDRERIARALHDGVIQVLFGVGTLLRNAGAETDQSEEGRRSLATSIDRIDSVIKDLRGYVMDLRPGLPADRQLHDALAMLTAEFEDESGIVVAIDIDATAAERLSAHAEDVLLMVREALSNVRRHAGATTCRVSLKPVDGTTLLEIDDDGCGFDPDQASGRGQGLRNLTERAGQIGGRLDIASGQAGTTLRAWLAP